MCEQSPQGEKTFQNCAFLCASIASGERVSECQEQCWLFGFVGPETKANRVKVVLQRASQVVLAVKNLPADTEDIRDVGSIPPPGRSPGGGLGNSLQYSCLEIS